MIELKPYNEKEHYPLLESWWKKHGWPAMPAQKLPPFGWLVYDGETPLAGSFAYLDNGGTGVAMLEWSVGNPAAPGRELVKGIRELFTFMVQELRKLDYDVVFTSCKVPGLIKIYEKCGFTRTDEGMTNLVHITPPPN